MSLKLEHVTKKYRDFTAVQDLNFEIEKGEIFGLIGQNGAGKTTTFRMILDLQETTEGQSHGKEKRLTKSTVTFSNTCRKSAVSSRR